MNYGAAIFFTDCSIGPVEIGTALEERGFESLWAPEHSHIPLTRKSPYPQGGDLPKKYYDVMDPFVTLSAAAAATKKLKVGTGICLVVQRDPDHDVQPARRARYPETLPGRRHRARRLLHCLGGQGQDTRHSRQARGRDAADRLINTRRVAVIPDVRVAHTDPESIVKPRVGQLSAAAPATGTPEAPGLRVMSSCRASSSRSALR